MPMVMLAAVQMVTVHMLDGREVAINPKEITRMQTGRPDDDPARQFPAGINCVIWFTDGKYLSISETCAAVRELMGKE